MLNNSIRAFLEAMLHYIRAGINCKDCMCFFKLFFVSFFSLLFYKDF